MTAAYACIHISLQFWVRTHTVSSDRQRLVTSCGNDWVCMHAGKPEEVVTAHARVCEALGAPEVLVYNAGPGGFTYPPPAALDISPEAFSRSFDSGVTGALVWAQQVLMTALCKDTKRFQPAALHVVATCFGVLLSSQCTHCKIYLQWDTAKWLDLP